MAHNTVGGKTTMFCEVGCVVLVLMFGALGCSNHTGVEDLQVRAFSLQSLPDAAFGSTPSTVHRPRLGPSTVVESHRDVDKQQAQYRPTQDAGAAAPKHVAEPSRTEQLAAQLNAQRQRLTERLNANSTVVVARAVTREAVTEELRINGASHHYHYFDVDFEIDSVVKSSDAPPDTLRLRIPIHSHSLPIVVGRRMLLGLERDKTGAWRSSRDRYLALFEMEGSRIPLLNVDVLELVQGPPSVEQ